MIIIELKRPAHPVEFDELQRLDGYQNELARAHPECRKVLIYGGNVNVQDNIWENRLRADDFEALTWSDMFKRAKTFYEHYRAVLDADISSPGFSVKQREVARTREIMKTGSAYRGERRKAGLGDTSP